MKLSIALLGVASVLAGAAFVHQQRDEGEARAGPATPGTVRFASDPGDASDAAQGSALERLERSSKMVAATKRALGEFELADGRRVQLYMADTTDAKACLLDVDAEFGPSTGCLEGGLFRARKAAFSVNLQGGPERFSELYLVGVVAPGIRAVSLVKTNGHATSLRLNAEGAFLFQSPKEDLEGRAYPVALRLVGPNGRLVETVTFPPAG